MIGGSEDLGASDAVQRFSTTDRVWTSLTLDALPTARWTTACATLDDVIYVFGGTTADQANGSDELLAFDPSLPVGERWITGLSRAPVVSQFAAVVPYGDRLLVTGLYNSASGDLTDVLAYLPGNDEWVPYTDLPEARGAGAAWVHDDVLYVGGGGYNSYLGSVVTYDLTEGAAGAWAATESLISGRRTVAFASDPATGWLYIAGGWNGAYMDSAEVGRLVTGAY